MIRNINKLKCFTRSATTLATVLIGLAAPLSANASSVNANVSATITGGIAGTATTGLSFGDISPGVLPGKVTVDLSGFRTSVGGVTLGLSTPTSPAIFQISGTPSRVYTVTTPGSLYLEDGAGHYMLVNNFTSNPSGSAGLLDAGGSQTLTVGGTLHVDANQPGGDYVGVLAMTVVYY